MLFAHNDDMGLGAIEAIEAAGKVPGKDIKIITIDAVKDGMQALADGKINFIVECSPLLGPQLMDLAKKVKAGETVPTRVRDRGDRRSTRSRPRRPCRTASTDHQRSPIGGDPAHRPGRRPVRRTSEEDRSGRGRPSVDDRPRSCEMNGHQQSSSRASRRSTASTSGSSPARCTR